MIPILISTRNRHKVAEIEAMLGDSFKVLDLSAVPAMPEVEETGTTFEGNATLKAVAASRLFDGWVLADDSGLEVDALNGEPGVYSARYAGMGATDSENNALLLQRLSNTPEQARSARFCCVMVVARAGRKMAAFEGYAPGRILFKPRGDGGFGYDPLFIPTGYTETFSQLPAATKNRISHRSQALEKLSKWRGFF